MVQLILHVHSGNLIIFEINCNDCCLLYYLLISAFELLNLISFKLLISTFFLLSHSLQCKAMESRLMTRWEIQKYARAAYDMGIRYIGGCCGFEPYHIRAIAEEVMCIYYFVDKHQGRFLIQKWSVLY